MCSCAETTSCLPEVDSASRSESSGHSLTVLTSAGGINLPCPHCQIHMEDMQLPPDLVGSCSRRESGPYKDALSLSEMDWLKVVFMRVACVLHACVQSPMDAASLPSTVRKQRCCSFDQDHDAHCISSAWDSVPDRCSLPPCYRQEGYILP